MRFVRSIVTQYYRRGKSLGRRDFHTSPSIYKDAIKAGISVVESIVTLGLGTGIAHLMIGDNAERAQRLAELWEIQQGRLEEEEAKLEQLLKFYGAGDGYLRTILLYA